MITLYRYQKGDIFLIPLKDNSFILAQVIEKTPEALNSVVCAFFDIRINQEGDLQTLESITKDAIFSILFVTPDHLTSRRWKVVANKSIDLPAKWKPIYHAFKANSWVGVKVRGSRIVENFVNAFYGLDYWDDWHDPHYLDNLLISSDKKPEKLLLKGTDK